MGMPHYMHRADAGFLEKQVEESAAAGHQGQDKAGQASCKQTGSRALPFVTEGQAVLEQQLLPSQSPAPWTSGVLGDLSKITLWTA